MKYFLSTVLLFRCLNFFAQTHEEFEIYSQKYPDKMAVIIDHVQHVTIDYIDDSIQIIQEDYERKLCLNNQAKLLSEDQVYETAFNKRIKLEAKTLIPYKKEFKEIVVSDFYETHDMDRSVFYDDFTSINFTFPSLQKGAQTILKHSYNYTNFYLLRTFYFGSFLPVINSKLTIKVHKSIKFNFKEFNTESLKFLYNKHEEGNYYIYEWEANEVKEYLRGNEIASMKYVLPHIVFYIGSINKNGKEILLLNTIDDLYNWYYQFVKNLKTDEDTVLNQLVFEITEGVNSDFEKAQIIYNWVQENINYIAFEDGLRGFVPNDAIIVFNNKYGDCKDMASLLTTLLNIAGLESYLTWIGTRALPYSYYDLPTPSSDNHMISTLFINDTVYFLDATSQYNAFTMPSYAIQGKEALISKGKDKYQILGVPVVPKEKSGITDSCFIEIKDEQVSGTGISVYKGYTNSDFISSVDGLKGEQLNEQIINVVKRGNNKFLVTDYVITDNGKNNPAKLIFRFTINDYSISAGDELYINMNLDKSLFNSIIEDTIAVIPVEYEYKFSDFYYTELIIPEGYYVGHIPANVKYNTDLLGFTINYCKTDSSVILEKSLYFNFLMLRKDEQEIWNETVKKISRAYRELIILKRMPNFNISGRN